MHCGTALAVPFLQGLFRKCQPALYSLL
jgi:hypothetical protein